MNTLKPVNIYFTETLEYRIYRLAKQSQEYNGCVSKKIARWPKRMDVHMKSAVFKPSDLILILPFSHNFMTACDLNEIHEGVAIWLFQLFMKDPPKPLSHIVSALLKNNDQQKEKS